MAPRSGEPGTASLRRFFLSGRPATGRPELLPGDSEHALRVLRVQVGDRLIGLDGKGGSWILRVREVARNRVELERDGEGRIDPRPGTEGSELPWIEIALPWPKGSRAEEMLDRLTQLGAAAIAELDCERAGPRPAGSSGARRERAERVLREACKQCSRTWLPELRERPSDSPAALLLLDPAAEVSLVDRILDLRADPAAWGSPARPWTVLVGPEGGFTDAEKASWLARGAKPARLGPHVLRLETAAEAAMAILAAGALRPRRS